MEEFVSKCTIAIYTNLVANESLISNDYISYLVFIRKVSRSRSKSKSNGSILIYST